MKRLLKFLASCLVLSISALFQSLISLLIGFLGFIISLLSTTTASWSLTPGITDVFVIRLVLLIKNRSRMLSPLVGSSTVCVSPKSRERSKNN